MHDGVNQMQTNNKYIIVHHAPYINYIFTVLFDNYNFLHDDYINGISDDVIQMQEDSTK